MITELHLGDCREILLTLEENSVDTCITDPPYELGFMGKDWDSAGVSFQKETWEAVYRVLKPGAFLLAFGGTRTSHRITVAIEDAGFEIRDTICWLYGQGFPKSHNISKAIDKKAGKEREIVEERYKSKHNGGSSYQWSEMNNETGEAHITAPATPEAELWEGWGTGLKPAFEPIIVAMKPIDGTYVENALKHGVSGLWIDGGKIEINDDRPLIKRNHHGLVGNTWEGGLDGTLVGSKNTGKTNEGRWPANVILDEEAAKLLDEQSGNLGKSSGGGMKDLKSGKLFMGDTYPNITDSTGFGDAGGASRFFYCAKASKKERNMGLDGLEKHKRDESRNIDQPSMNDGEGNPYNRGVKLVTNHHPTVKPLALMQYLVRLTKTPTGGIVLDPFMGSGTTGMACILEGREFIGIEMDKEYYEISEKRIEAIRKTQKQIKMFD